MSYKPSKKQGQNKHTVRKQANLAAALAISLDISQGGQPFPYWHIDLHAGCGWNHTADCAGSPLVFVEQAFRHKRHFNALFCDSNGEFIAELAGRLKCKPIPNESDPKTYTGDNSEALRQFSEWIGSKEEMSYAIGTCYCDPNGFTSEIIPIDELRRFSATCPRIDLIININASLFARVHGCKGSDSEAIRKGFAEWPTPLEFLRTLNRRHWMVSSPPAGGGSIERFFLAVGRNFDTGTKRYRDFYRLESQFGQDIVNYPFKHIPDGQEMLFKEW